MNSAGGIPIDQSLPRTRRTALLLGVFLALATLAVFWPLTQAQFNNYDDQQYILENPQVQHGLNADGIKWAFTSGYAANWHPLTWISHMADNQFYGLDPGKHHRTNLLIHTINVVLLFGFLCALLGSIWRSAVITALFAWHPAHVESVAWIAERKDVLSAFFWLLSSWGYLSYARAKLAPSTSTTTAPRKARVAVFYGLSLLAFALGLMSKPMVVTLPCVFFLLDFWPLQRIHGREQPASAGVLPHIWQSTTWICRHLLLEKIPFFLLSTAACVATYSVQGAGGAFGTRSFAIDTRLANALVAYVRYLGKLVWPTNLAVFYPYPESWAVWQVLGSLLILIGITWYCLRAIRPSPGLLVGWLWFLGTLVPAIGLVQVGSQSMADRYTYLPAIGIFLALVCAIPPWALLSPNTRRGLDLLAVITLGGCLVMTHVQIAYWHDSFALFQHAIDVTENNSLAHYNLGQALSSAGKWNEAIAHYQEAIRIEPTNPKAYNNLGLSLAATGQWKEAVDLYQHAIKLDPDNSEAYFNCGLALKEIGQLDEAIIYQQNHLRLQPNHAEANCALGELLIFKGHFSEAKTQFQEAIRKNPNLAAAHLRLGMVLAREENALEAINHYREAVRSNPDGIEALNNLAWMLATDSHPQFRNGPEAVKAAEHAARVSHGSQAFILGTLAASYAEAGRFNDAIATAKQAISVAKVNSQSELATRNQQLLALYEANQAYHEPAKISSGK